MTAIKTLFLFLRNFFPHLFGLDSIFAAVSHFFPGQVRPLFPRLHFSWTIASTFSHVPIFARTSSPLGNSAPSSVEEERRRCKESGKNAGQEDIADWRGGGSLQTHKTKDDREMLKTKDEDKKATMQRGLHYITDWRRHTSDIKRGQMLKGMITQTRQRPKTFKAKWQCHLQGF